MIGFRSREALASTRKAIASTRKAIASTLPLIVCTLALIWWLIWYGRALDERDRLLDRQTAAALTLSRSWRSSFDVASTASQEADRRATRALQRANAAEATSSLLHGQIASLMGDTSEFWEDSTRAWRELYDLRTIEAESLRVAYVRAQQAVAILRPDRDRWRSVADSAYRVVIPTLETALRAERDARRCRIAGLIPCPSTTALIVGSLAVGAAAGAAAAR